MAVKRERPGSKPRRGSRPGGPGHAPRPAARSEPRQPRRPAARPAAKAKGLWLYGRHAVEAALANPRRSCHRLLATPEGLASLAPAARRPGLEVTTAEREELDRRLGAGAVHQGLAL